MSVKTVTTRSFSAQLFAPYLNLADPRPTFLKKNNIFVCSYLKINKNSRIIYIIKIEKMKCLGWHHRNPSSLLKSQNNIILSFWKE